jgi:hypothetical protein
MLTGSGQFDKSDGTGAGLWDDPPASLGRSANSRLLSLFVSGPAIEARHDRIGGMPPCTTVPG